MSGLYNCIENNLKAVVMDYSKLSDFEIERKITELTDIDFINCESWEWDEDQQVFWPVCRGSVPVPPYCADWRITGQLLEDNKISLRSFRSGYDASFFDAQKKLERQVSPVSGDSCSMFIASNKNPKRAIAECFLMMKEGE